MSIQAKLWLALSAWAILIVVALTYAAESKIVVFDHDGRLYKASQHDDFDTNIANALALLHPTDKKTVIHFESDDCTCQWVAAPHIESVKQLAAQHDYHNQQVNLQSAATDWLLAYVPATPAIAVINEFGVLTYFGPYSTGMYCSPGEGLVERFIQQKQAINLGTVIPFDASGCYCRNPLAKI